MPLQSANIPEVLTVDQWKGLNQQSTRSTIEDQELWWSENLYQVGPGSLRSMWGPSPPVYTAPSGLSIRRFFCGFYGNNLPQYGQPPPGRKAWMFLSDGSIDEVDLSTQAVTRIGGGVPLWNPVAPKYWADAVVWRPRWVGGTLGEVGGVLFGSPGGQAPGMIGGVVAWDGTNVYRPGEPAPLWLTYADVTGTTATTMPYGLPDVYAMEVYMSRLWVAGKDVISWSAPTNGTDFSDVNGGGSIAYFGDKLTYTYTDLASSSGYLFCFGDSSTDVISQPTSLGSGSPGSPYTTVFQYTNADPQVGHLSPRPVGKWGRYLVMMNGAGIWQMLGGDAQNVSEKVSRIHRTLDTTQFYPTFASTTTMFGFRVLLCNARWTDPFGQTRSFMLVWNGDSWTVASQHYNLIEINQYEDSSIIIPYGTDGTSLYQLFWLPDPTLKKILSTKSLRGEGVKQLTVKDWKRVYLEVQDETGLGIPLLTPPEPEQVPHGVSIIGTMTTSGGAEGGVCPLSFELPSSMQSAPRGTRPVPLSKTAIIPCRAVGKGIAAQLDLQSNSPDFTIERIHLAAVDTTFFGV
jgi:hypothetical protein